MPTYDYECSSCGHRFEVFEGVHVTGVRKCDKCGKRKARRQIGTGAGFLFKGSGFYTTDYARKGVTVESSKESGSKETPAAKETAPKEASKEKSKPAASEKKKPKSGV